MKIQHFLYGEFECDDPIFKELLSSKYLQRLKGIATGGFYPGGFAEQQSPYWDRYTHSVGVWFLLRKFKASIEEQIAGLLHDVSHSTFSHTLDYIDSLNITAQQKHSSQDAEHEEFVMQTDIPQILQKYGYDIKDFLENPYFTMLDISSPYLCADRLDAGLREGFLAGHLTKDDVNRVLEGITVQNNEFYFNNIEAAKLFTEKYWQVDKFEYSNKKTAIMFYYGGRLLAEMLNKKYISRQDLFDYTDNDIIKKFEENAESDTDVRYLLKLLHQPTDNFIYDSNKDDILPIYAKVRKINPKVITDSGNVVLYSDVSPEYHDKFTNRKKFLEYRIEPK